jgi:hypothetical protein
MMMLRSLLAWIVLTPKIGVMSAQTIPPLQQTVRLPDHSFLPGWLWGVMADTIPYLAGASLTFLGVILSNRHQRRLQSDIKRKEHEYWKEQRLYELKRDAVRNCFSLMREAEHDFRSHVGEVEWARALKDSPFGEAMRQAAKRTENQYFASVKRITAAFAEAELYVSESAAEAIRSTLLIMNEIKFRRTADGDEANKVRLTRLEGAMQETIRKLKAELRQGE